MLDQENSRGRLFISYSRRNRDQVYPFAEALTAAGIAVWIDREEIDPFDDFPERISDGLARSFTRLVLSRMRTIDLLPERVDRGVDVHEPAWNARTLCGCFPRPDERLRGPPALVFGRIQMGP
jgi:hypothetical protein